MVLFRPTIFVFVIQNSCIPGASVYLLDRLRYFILVVVCLLTYHYELACSRKSFWGGDTPIYFESHYSPDDLAHLTVHLFYV